MHYSFRSALQLSVLALVLCLNANPATAAATATSPGAVPVENFFQLSKISNVRFSPDGKAIAMLAAGANDRLVLSIMDSGDLKPKILAAYQKTDVVSFSWISSERLVYSVGDRAMADGEIKEGGGLYAINKDGSEARQLIEPGLNSNKFRVLNARHSMAFPTYWADSDDIFVTRNAGTRNAPSLTLFRLNSKTGALESIASPPNTQSFLLDSSNQLRLVTTQTEQMTALHYKNPGNGEWRKLLEYDSSGVGGVTPLFIDPAGQLFVSTSKHSDTQALYRYDLEHNKLDDKPLMITPGFDFNGRFMFNKKDNKLLGAHYETDAFGTLWLDDRMKSIQQAVDAALPNTVNQISVASNGDTPLVLVYAFSDVHPGSFLIYHTDTKKFSAIGDVYPQIDSRQMSFKEFVRIKARDGMEIPTYLTLPKNSNGKNLPLVVMVHGGPFVRGGHWAWDPHTQFLASRGYAVIEPDFRGSTGYGNKLFRAGWKQWGLAMQDDVTDVTRWAIDKGFADAGRICIAGASYGGYATLMGLIREPQLYRCGISWVGVTDINYLFDVTWSDTSGSIWSRYGMPLMIGDQLKDAAQLKATSPLEQASRLQRPLILAYGGADVRVPLVHGESFRKAAPKDVPIEWIVYPEEGHGWRKLDNNIDFWTRVEKFLNSQTSAK